VHDRRQARTQGRHEYGVHSQRNLSSQRACIWDGGLSLHGVKGGDVCTRCPRTSAAEPAAKAAKNPLHSTPRHAPGRRPTPARCGVLCRVALLLAWAEEVEVPNLEEQLLAGIVAPHPHAPSRRRALAHRAADSVELRLLGQKRDHHPVARPQLPGFAHGPRRVRQPHPVLALTAGLAAPRPTPCGVRCDPPPPRCALLSIRASHGRPHRRDAHGLWFRPARRRPRSSARRGCRRRRCLSAAVLNSRALRQRVVCPAAGGGARVLNPQHQSTRQRRAGRSWRAGGLRPEGGGLPRPRPAPAARRAPAPKRRPAPCCARAAPRLGRAW